MVLLSNSSLSVLARSFQPSPLLHPFWPHRRRATNMPPAGLPDAIHQPHTTFASHSRRKSKTSRYSCTWHRHRKRRERKNKPKKRVSHPPKQQNCHAPLRTDACSPSALPFTSRPSWKAHKIYLPPSSPHTHTRVHPHKNINNLRCGSRSPAWPNNQSSHLLS